MFDVYFLLKADLEEKVSLNRMISNKIGSSAFLRDGFSFPEIQKTQLWLDLDTRYAN
jgi:hypothetical protein